MLARTVAFNSSHAASQEINGAPVAAACRLVACILHNPKLTQLDLDHAPSACVGHAAWQGEGLPVPPSEVAAKGWTEVLEFLRKAKAADIKAASDAKAMAVAEAKAVADAKAAAEAKAAADSVVRFLQRDIVRLLSHLINLSPIQLHSRGGLLAGFLPRSRPYRPFQELGRRLHRRWQQPHRHQQQQRQSAGQGAWSRPCCRAAWQGHSPTRLHR